MISTFPISPVYCTSLLYFARREKSMQDFIKKKNREIKNLSLDRKATLSRDLSALFQRTTSPSQFHDKTVLETYLWWKKVKHHPVLKDTYEELRTILKKERKRHILTICRPKATTVRNEDLVCAAQSFIFSFFFFGFLICIFHNHNLLLPLLLYKMNLID